MQPNPTLPTKESPDCDSPAETSPQTPHNAHAPCYKQIENITLTPGAKSLLEKIKAGKFCVGPESLINKNIRNVEETDQYWGKKTRHKNTGITREL